MTPLPALTGLAAAACFVLSSALSPAAPAATTSSERMTVSPAFVSPSGDGPGGCGFVNSQWACHVTIRNPGTITISWHSYGLDASGQSPLPATITPNHGSLAPGSSVRVTISTSDCGFSLADLANFLGWSGSTQQGTPPLGGAVLFSCG